MDVINQQIQLCDQLILIHLFAPFKKFLLVIHLIVLKQIFWEIINFKYVEKLLEFHFINLYYLFIYLYFINLDLYVPLYYLKDFSIIKIYLKNFKFHVIILLLNYFNLFFLNINFLII